MKQRKRNEKSRREDQDEGNEMHARESDATAIIVVGRERDKTRKEDGKKENDAQITCKETS